MLASIIAVVISIVTLPFIWWFVYLYKVKSLLDIPGPKPLPVLGNILDVGSNPCDLLNNMHKLCQEYKGLFKIFTGPDIRVIFSRPELLEPLLTSNVNISKSSNYELIQPWLGNGLLLSTGDKWKSRRKMINPAFHIKNLEQYVETFDACADILVQNLAKKVGANGVDIKPYISNYALDVLCNTLMGVNARCQEDQNVEFVEAVRKFLDIIMIRFFSCWERYSLLFKFSRFYAAYKESLKTLIDFSNDVIRSKREQLSTEINEQKDSDEDEMKNKVGLLDLLLRYRNSNRMTHEDMREELDTFVFTGHDTVSSSMMFTLYALANHPNVQQGVYEELVQAFGDSKTITRQKIKDLKYLDIVIKESMRLYTNVPIIERKLDEDIIIEGKTYPAGLTIGLFLYGMHNCEEFFPEPEKFDPERFLPENMTKRHNFAYVPFSIGARNCIGQNYALLETKAIIIKILQNFILLPIPGFKPLLGLSSVLQSYNGIHVRLEHRK